MIKLLLFLVFIFFTGLANNGKNIIMLVDYTKPSNEIRLYVMDLTTEHVVFQSRVAHGVNSGKGRWALNFSNTKGSLTSSLGLIRVGEGYYGHSGYSYRLDGLEKGKNDNIRKRFITLHRAEYVSDRYFREHGRIGTSEGCIAVPTETADQLFAIMYEGAFIYVRG